MVDSKPDIQVFNQTERSIPVKETLYPDIAKIIADKEDCSFNFVEVVYVGEDEIIQINKEHLDRDYVTDIITLRYDEPDSDSGIEGTLFCCAPRIEEQAEEFKESTEREFLRIYIHGLLHLAGYDDQSDEEKKQMTDKENHYLNLVADFPK